MVPGADVSPRHLQDFGARVNIYVNIVAKDGSGRISREEFENILMNEGEKMDEEEVRDSRCNKNLQPFYWLDKHLLSCYPGQNMTDN